MGDAVWVRDYADGENRERTSCAPPVRHDPRSSHYRCRATAPNTVQEVRKETRISSRARHERGVVLVRSPRPAPSANAIHALRERTHGHWECTPANLPGRLNTYPAIPRSMSTRSMHPTPMYRQGSTAIHTRLPRPPQGPGSARWGQRRGRGTGAGRACFRKHGAGQHEEYAGDAPDDEHRATTTMRRN